MNQAYQNQIVYRLREVCDWMLSEFKTTGDNSWTQHREFINKQVKQYIKNRLKTGETFEADYFGADPWLYNQYEKAILYKKDIFVPIEFRDKIYELYSQRIDNMYDIMERVFDDFLKYLDENEERLNNVNECQLYFNGEVHNSYTKAGWSFADFEKKALTLIGEIEKYLVELE